ncbi:MULTISPECIES: LysR family transcriptional regulator [Stenotrophomonas]|uniref:LysR family transcriptional regulator n=1 Tax=Stenotrophomonas acidaminiphila TaxID=128780 RepID=A0A0S1B0X4_9GAMM|nr:MULTISPECIES: LysR family transcriptional regulator [Stenotrophomonas]ALJ28725.1 LysR family transcriptional regulator [Stenotrophomonas acidaminiphila]MBN8802054.1 LysR family transcriptional regulator [Stenotrophomonas acidaminiphila]MCA7022651.1 LysR family transcriptional regulator [Stenotrophomonas acidaminiphila]MCE4075091.1 LysR family transcriptional regulator [Stenotrophomonas acidaminiphila]MDF9442980.1 LysR family transcriptional regulator [Stenotrophomonas acidaminiphila]
METQFLNTFVTVVDRGSMAAAARMLHITPAAVAQQIRTLERELGAPLIARAGRTVSVTAEGARILQRARDLLRDVSDLRSVANESGMAGELRLGACPTALAGLVPDILARMVAKFPEINVFIRPGYSADLYGAVEAGDLDAAMVLQAPFSLPKTCDWQLLREEPMVVLAPARLAARDPHDLLRDEPLIRYDRHEWGGRQADEYLRRVGIVPRERFELNALNAIAVMVDRGLGVSLVPDWARPWPEGLAVARLPLPEPCEPRRIGMVWSRSSVRIRQVNALLEEGRAELLPGRA